MGFKTLSSFPIFVQLEHDDVILETDEAGENIYTVVAVHWAERAGSSWVVSVAHPATGKLVETTINPNETGQKNLPPPQRFPTNTDFRISIVR